MAEHRPGASSEHIASGTPPLADPNKNGVPVPDPAQAKALSKKAAAASETKDSVREIIETVVFVVVLVLLLKSFVAEAFVIPTGSMAETLYGYQKIVKCPKCDFEFPVNCSSEVDPQQGSGPAEVVGGICPNCRFHVDFKDAYGDKSRWPSYNTGDRVLVAKFVYDLNLGFLGMPERYQVVVFKYPEKPQKDYVPLNYIKRLIGMPRETIAIYYGKLYHYTGLNYEEEDRDIPPLELWTHMHVDDKQAEDLFAAPTGGKFKILRKPAKQVLAERRMVFDNDFQPKDLEQMELKRWQRWQAEHNDGSWTYDNNDEPRAFKHAAREAGDIDWMRYQHLLPADNRRSVRPELITDFMGYNTWLDATNMRHATPAPNWVGDLMLECDVDVQQASGEFVFELSKGIDRFRARWDLASGRCTLLRLMDGKESELASEETTVKRPGSYHLRFANVDERLLVWVNSALPFGDDGKAYGAPRERGPRRENDLDRPASIGVKGGAVTVSHVKLWRDTYYTANVHPSGNGPDAERTVDFSNPNDWGPLSSLPVRTYYVQPGHFLCLGDNSPESSDGRSWGLVPKRLLLGRALLIYYPFFNRNRAGRIE
jgi:signal peptidase I